MSRNCQKCNRNVFFAEEREESGIVWHLFCFSCILCNRLLSTKDAILKNNVLYCVDCMTKKDQKINEHWEETATKAEKNLDNQINNNSNKNQHAARSRLAERRIKASEDDQSIIRPRTACCGTKFDNQNLENYDSYLSSPLDVLNYYSRQHLKNSAIGNLSSGEKRTEIDSSKSPPVHQSIELFNKPNVIETSLPRYQNKHSKLTNANEHKIGEKKIDSEKTEKLKEFFHKNFQFIPHEGLRKKTGKDYRNVRFGKGYVIFNNASKEENEDLRPEKAEKEKRNLVVKIDEDLTSKVSKNELKEKAVSPLSPRKKINDYEDQENSLKILETETTNDQNCWKFSLSKSSEVSNSGNNQVYGGGWDCHRCGRNVYHAERMLACGNAYHNACFSCVDCKKLLGPRTYLEADMEIYCGQCHAKRFKLTGYGYGMGPGVLQT